LKNFILGVTVGIGKDVVLPHPFSGVKSKYEVVQASARLAASAAAATAKGMQRET
jgi:hypothetical protein